MEKFDLKYGLKLLAFVKGLEQEDYLLEQFQVFYRQKPSEDQMASSFQRLEKVHILK